MGLVWFSQELKQKTLFEIKHSTQSQPESRYYKSRGTLNLNQSVERVLQVFPQEAVCATELYGCGKDKEYVLQQWKKMEMEKTIVSCGNIQFGAGQSCECAACG